MSSLRYRLANKEKIAEGKRRHYAANREKVSEASRRHYLANREKILKQSKEYNALNREKKCAYLKEYYAKNRANLIEQNRQYVLANAEKISVYQKQWRIDNREGNNARRRRKRASDTNWRLRLVLGGRIRSALTRHLSGTAVKAASTMKLIGCDLDWLAAWLEVHFKQGMSWDNYGDWHIDHIRPCASFDLTDTIQQKRCFHWTNLQPLFARENLIKGANV